MDNSIHSVSGQHRSDQQPCSDDGDNFDPLISCASSNKQLFKVKEKLTSSHNSKSDSKLNKSDSNKANSSDKGGFHLPLTSSLSSSISNFKGRKSKVYQLLSVPS